MELAEIQLAVGVNRPVDVGPATVAPVAHQTVTHAVHTAAVTHTPTVAARYHAHPAGQVFNQLMSNPYQGEHKSTIQFKALLAGVATTKRCYCPFSCPCCCFCCWRCLNCSSCWIAEPSHCTRKYAIIVVYSSAAFNQVEFTHGTGVVNSSYSANLPNAKIRHLKCHDDDYEGHIAEVTYYGNTSQREVVAHPVAKDIALPVEVVDDTVAHATAHSVNHGSYQWNAKLVQRLLLPSLQPTRAVFGIHLM